MGVRARRRSVLGVSAALLACACGAPTELEPRVRARSTAGVYGPGSLLLIRISNPTGRAIVNDRCAGELEGWTLGGFGGPPPMTVSRFCGTPVPPTRIDVGGTAEDTLQIPPTFVVGQWRVRLDLRDDRGRLLPDGERTTNIFTVK